MEIEQTPIFRQEPPRRALDASTASFSDYGYQTPGKLITALKRSLRAFQIPHLLFSFGEPENGKEHVTRDIIAKLYYKNPNEEDPNKRGKGLIPELEDLQGFPIPIYLVGWGYMFSILKAKGLAPVETKYGGFTLDHINKASLELDDIVSTALRENQGKRAIIAVKTPAVAAARFEGELFGANLGFTTAEKITYRRDKFKELKYRDFWVAGKAEYEVEIQGDAIRPKLEKLVDQPEEFLKALEESGEKVLLPPEGLTEQVMQELINMVLYAANPEAVQKFRNAASALAVEMAKRGRLRLKGSYTRDEGYAIINPIDRVLSTNLVLRSLLETDLNIHKRVYLGLYGKQSNMIIDLSMPIQNPAIDKCPDIEKYRNK